MTFDVDIYSRKITKVWDRYQEKTEERNGEKTKPYKIMQLATNIADYFDNDWTHSSTLNSYLNDDISGYLSTISNDWQSKIAENMTWYVGGYSTNETKIKTFYNAENGMCTSGMCLEKNDTTTKIGLINVYDYGYAASPTSWTIDTLGNYNNSTITANNWLYRGANSSYEWTLTPLAGNYSPNVFYVDDTGSIRYTFAFSNYNIRPVFYLTSPTNYESGTGTSTDPFLVS